MQRFNNAKLYFNVFQTFHIMNTFENNLKSSFPDLFFLTLFSFELFETLEITFQTWTLFMFTHLL